MKRTEGYWSFRRGDCEPTTEDRLEIEARTAALRAQKQAQGHIGQEYNVEALRQATAVYRCIGNGSRRRQNSIVKNY